MHYSEHDDAANRDADKVLEFTAFGAPPSQQQLFERSQAQYDTEALRILCDTFYDATKAMQEEVNKIARRYAELAFLHASEDHKSDMSRASVLNARNPYGAHAVAHDLFVQIADAVREVYGLPKPPER